MTNGRVILCHHWDADEATEVIVEAAAHPDGLDDARAVAVRAFAEALGVVTSEALADDD